MPDKLVALLELDGYYSNDIAAYEGLAGLPNITLTNVLIDGFNGTRSAAEYRGVAGH